MLKRQKLKKKKKTKCTQAAPPPPPYQNQGENLAETGHIYAHPFNTARDSKGAIQRQI